MINNQEKDKKGGDIILPFESDKIKSYLKKNETAIYVHILHKIEDAIDNFKSSAEIFRFEKGKHIITISESDFKDNVINAYKFFIKKELYELCPLAKMVEEKINTRIEKVHTKYI